MKKIFTIVVDSNMLNSQELLDYLCSSKYNKVVLPDYIAMEAYKGNRFESIIDSMKTISIYPEQIIILNPTRMIGRFKDVPDVLKWKFVNQRDTKSFSDFCRLLQLAKNGNSEVQKYILEHVAAANKQMEVLLNDALSLEITFKEIADLFDENEKKIIRKSLPFTPNISRKVYHLIQQLADDFYFKHPDHKQIPNFGVNNNCFLFRFAIAGVFLAIKWTARGNPPKLKVERIRNDIVDAALVAYSTYYDGLLTNDQDMMWLQAVTDRFLEIAPYKPLNALGEQ